MEPHDRGTLAVLHLARSWGLPSESFVRALIESTPGCQAIVRVRDLYGGARCPDVAALPSPVWMPTGLSDRVAIARLAVMARRADIVHSHFLNWSAIGARAAGIAGRPWVLSLHGRDLLVEAQGEAERALVRRAAAVIVPSPFLAEHAIAAGVDEARIRIIPSGIDVGSIPFVPRTPPVGRKPIVTFVGRFVEKKGVLDAAQAIAATTRSGAPVSARFVGYGPLEHALRQCLAELGVDATIIDGSAPGASLAAIRDTDLVITPSRTGADGDAETLCVVNLEAQASGAPVLTTRHGGIPFGVSEDSAVLVPEGDPVALGRALTALVSVPDRWQPMGAAGRAFVDERFSWERRALEVRDVYVELMGRRPGGAPPA